MQTGHIRGNVRAGEPGRVVNRTPAKHAALRRIADGGDGLGLLQAGWPDNTLDELCKAGLFTWVTGECRLTEVGVETLARWDREAAEKPSDARRAPKGPRASGRAIRPREGGYSPGNGAPGRRRAGVAAKTPQDAPDGG